MAIVSDDNFITKFQNRENGIADYCQEKTDTASLVGEWHINQPQVSTAASHQRVTLSVEHDDIDRRNRLTEYQEVMSQIVQFVKRLTARFRVNTRCNRSLHWNRLKIRCKV